MVWNAGGFQPLGRSFLLLLGHFEANSEPQEEERKKREEIERKIREEAEKKRADEIASKKQARMRPSSAIIVGSTGELSH